MSKEVLAVKREAFYRMLDPYKEPLDQDKFVDMMFM
jgi:hypothetical protein